MSLNAVSCQLKSPAGETETGEVLEDMYVREVVHTIHIPRWRAMDLPLRQENDCFYNFYMFYKEEP